MQQWQQQQQAQQQAQQQQAQQQQLQQQQMAQRQAAGQAGQGVHVAPPGKGGGGAAPAQGSHPDITVAGCQNETVANIIIGSFKVDSENHGRPVYKKVQESTVSVLMYFWDERDGAAFSGWWFGPKVGGDQVWAYNESKTAMLPPPGGWKVPWDGPVDQQLTLTHTQPQPAGSSAGKGQQQQQWAQQQQQQAQQGGKGWGEAQQGGNGWGEAQKGGKDWGKAQQQAKGWQQGGQGMSEEDRQKQIAAREQHMANMKAKEEERKKQDEEIRKRQAEKEEEMQRRQAELKKKREDEELRRTEQAASLVVRKAIQRVRIATPESYDELRAELEKALEENLEKMGTQAEKVQQEAEKALLQAQERVDQIAEKRQLDEQKREEAILKKKEEAEKVERLSKEAVAEVEEVETKVAEGTESVKIENNSSPESMLEAIADIEKAADSMKSVLDVVSKSLSEKRTELGNGQLAVDCLKKEFVGHFRKLAACRRKVATLKDSTKGYKDIANRKTKALKKETDIRNLFNKFDKDKDGKLKRAEVATYSKTNFEFELSGEVLDKILRQLAKDDVGVPFAKFSRLKAMVAIARSEVRARAKRAEEAEKERIRKEEDAKRLAALEEKKADMQLVFDEVIEKLKSAEASAIAAEKTTDEFDEVIGKGDMSSSELTEAAAKAVASSAESRASLASAKEKLEEAESTECEEDELQHWKGKQAGQLKPRFSQVEHQLDRVSAAVKVAEEKATRKAYVELEALKTATATALRELMSTDGIDGAALFDKISGGAAEVSCEKFAAFVRSLKEPSFEDEQAERLFTHVSRGADELSKEIFLETIKLFYKVTKASVLTAEVAIKSKTHRRLDVGEVVEGLDAPKKDDAVGVTRMRCKAVTDGLEGYVTIAGNQGTVFLEPGGSTYKCIKDTFITADLSVVDSKNVRKIKLGEVVDILEFDTLDASCNVKRIKVKAKNDGAVGWVTVAGNQGTAFMEPC